MKRIISLLLILCIVLSCSMVTYSDNSGSSYTSTSVDDKITFENKKYMLIFDTESYLLEIKDKKSGFVWNSNFVDNSDDNVVMGITKTDMLSNIVVSYAFGSDIKTTNSRVGSILKNNAKVKEIMSSDEVTIYKHAMDLKKARKYEEEIKYLKQIVKAGKTKKYISEAIYQVAFLSEKVKVKSEKLRIGSAYD